jgi:exopolysaccharide production protein ExoZ
MFSSLFSDINILRNKATLLRLQSLRALAAFIVMAGHVTHEAETISEETGRFYNYIPYPNAVGVDIFFVISGFVIVYASHKLMGQARQAKYFMVRRLMRIVPIYWFYSFLMIGTVMLIPSMVDTIRPELGHIFKSLFFYPHMRPLGDAVRPFYALGWSLNYEMYFYLIFAVLLFLPLKRLMIALTIYLSGSVIAGLFLPADLVALKFWFDPYVLEFLAGAWIAYGFIQGWRLPARWFELLLGISIVILIALFFPVQNSIESQLMRFFVGIILVAGMTLPKGSEEASPPALFSALGDSSYSLYLSHPFAIGAMKVLWIVAGLGLSLWIYVGVTIIACLIAGHLSYLLIERPMLIFFKARLKTGSK